MIRIGSLFSGYGGLDLAVQSVLGGEVAWHVEYDKAPSRILDHHFPGVPNYGDVTQLDFTSVEPVDVITGGYPCQPFSHAGLRKGTNDERHLWPHVLRAIREMGPRLAILENVRGHLSLGFDTVLADLASVGWSARWGIVRASDAGAPHQRARLFIVAYPDGGRRKQSDQGERLLQLPNEDSHGAPTDASGLHPMGRRDAGTVRRVESQAEGEPRQRKRTRGAISSRGKAAIADAQLHGLNGDTLGRGTSASQEERRVRQSEGRDAKDWGDYGAAIARWERVLGRRAPAPTEPGPDGGSRLAPRFVEWMMGLPDGWVTDPAIGISRNDQLKALGNGVVPQQAALALDVLLQGTTDDLRQTFATV